MMTTTANQSWIIVGASANIADANELAKFYGKVFPRLFSEIKHHAPVNRILGFEKTSKNSSVENFIGIETEHTDFIPDGLLRWELGNDHLSIIEKNTRIVKPLTWHWKNTAPNGRITGEFYLDNIPSTLYRMSANACFDQNQPNNDNVVLTDYDSSWPAQYQHMATWLLHTFGPDTILRLEHYGSTAIPGLPAKPVIDILIEIPSFDTVRPLILPVLNNEEWEYWWYIDHMIFIRRETRSGQRTHHLHLAPAGHRLWEGIAFRNYLRRHPETAEQYAALKYELSEHFRNDREGYTNAKTAFVRKITDIALANQNCR